MQTQHFTQPLPPPRFTTFHPGHTSPLTCVPPIPIRYMLVSLDLYMETPRRVARLGIQVSGWGAELMGLMTDRFDSARVVQHAAFRRSAIDIKAFWGTHRDGCASTEF